MRKYMQAKHHLYRADRTSSTYCRVRHEVLCSQKTESRDKVYQIGTEPALVGELSFSSLRMDSVSYYNIL